MGRWRGHLRCAGAKPELFGVLHLKGSVIDDKVLYSGANINDVYLARRGRYRLDRYHLIQHQGLADSLAAFVSQHIRSSEGVTRLDTASLPATRDLQNAIRHLRWQLQRADYQVSHESLRDGDVAVTPRVGFGLNDNQFNDTLLMLLRHARRRVNLFTPYFNLPRLVHAVLGVLLRRSCAIDNMAGDKKANDFYNYRRIRFTK
jgi:CDP-diacylglycerol---serine O-phosphatidyltransferase